jgi:hypothetical protein
MANIENTVPAENQMIASSVVSFLGEANAPLKILIVGNSITRHGPKTEIGWSGDWGMAASAQDKDYVHRLFAKLKESGKNVHMRIRQASTWECQFNQPNCLNDFQGERDFNADIVIFRLGENVAKENEPLFQDALRKFIPFICPNGKALFTTCFWKNPVLDEAIKAVANERNELCIDCRFSTDERTMALGQFEHTGVAAHPSDFGMEKIATSIFNALMPLLAR